MAQLAATTLQDLPLEILTLICTNLCHHCFWYEVSLWKPSCEPSALHYSDFKERKHGLVSLVAASRQLRRAALPVLWHQLDTMPAGPCSKDKILSYIRLFLDKKELRSAVKLLYINGRDERCTCCPHVENDLSLEERRLVRKAAKKTGLPIMMGDFDFDNYTETLVQVLISMLPALGEIHLGIPHTWTFENLQIWRSKGVPINGEPTRFLVNVRRIEIEVDGPEYAQCREGHDECKVITPKSLAEQVLIESAPRLETLSCTAGGLDSLPFLPRLKYLELQPRGYWDKILLLFDRLPRLTHLRYCTANEHSPSPRMLEGALRPLAGTLEVLSLSIQRFITRPSFGCYDEWEPPLGDEWVMESLEGFISLKSVSIDAGMIWRGRGKEGNRVFDVRDGSKIAHFLPRSLETAFIDDLYGDVGPMLPLAKSVATGSYPNLKRVLWYEVGSVGEMAMTLDKRHMGDDWLDDGNWNSQVCNNQDLAHIRAIHTLSDGHLTAFPEWEDLYVEQRRRHDAAI